MLVCGHKLNHWTGGSCCYHSIIIIIIVIGGMGRINLLCKEDAQGGADWEKKRKPSTDSSRMVDCWVLLCWASIKSTPIKYHFPFCCWAAAAPLILLQYLLGPVSHPISDTAIHLQMFVCVGFNSQTSWWAAAFYLIGHHHPNERGVLKKWGTQRQRRSFRVCLFICPLNKSPARLLWRRNCSLDP